MRKRKDYKRIHFPAETIKEAHEMFVALSDELGDEKIEYGSLAVETGDSEWNFDSFDEFIAEYRISENGKRLSVRRSGTVDGIWKIYELDVSFVDLSPYGSKTSVAIFAPTRDAIHGIFDVFEKNAKASYMPEPEKIEPPVVPVIFIGHGHSMQWRDLKDHLTDQHGYQVEAYETGARAGHAIRDILEDMARKSSFALLILTGDDHGPDDKSRARQNVIHETGLFQGRLGFERAIVLLENGVEEFSNLDGIHQIRFSKGNIRETFGDVLATLRREFGERN